MITANMYMIQALCRTLFMDNLVVSFRAVLLIELCSDANIQCYYMSHLEPPST